METKERRVGTISRGIRCPIIREGDNLVEIVTGSVLAAVKNGELQPGSLTTVLSLDPRHRPVEMIADTQNGLLLYITELLSPRMDQEVSRECP